MTSCRRSRIVVGVVLVLLMVAPVISLAEVAWVKDFDAALKQAAKEKKFIILDISASW